MSFSNWVLPEREKKSYQKYEVHLTNGEVLSHFETYPCGGKLSREFESCKSNETFMLHDIVKGKRIYVRKRDIYYIASVGFWFL